ncbi:MAG: alcohol dehydrogenase catalytic domain-containing protein [Lentisphaerae bacterium]|jgi:L-iditol 2-dehydrogenase|nr:alcohol dehydrogenase catalytic domain-containing protein [Lentisphaerota bacterium]MBT4819392.1 alcohol dehydrogenase catalytic domain-containing protein [Lentisphaerota bacterium]MBT5609752.1 alcohol dehydrogenase catalytic domain-containing protein [Lentisphaerota bacterium]MBT7061394.1 alcohol dehydrogenase catalytic domain-containing protein [Lentisphaerota bacterium]MBT7845084.1 alcohol dehydrogenase catalytic domain-containing protein [Lentisphaerota bacterium]
MKSAQLTNIREMAINDVPAPRIMSPTDVLLRVEAVGVCGSDVHYYATGRIGSQVVEFPYAVGHEAAATVQEIGSEVTRVQPGDRVAIEPGVACHRCDQCLSGRAHTCRNLKYLACPGQIEGCLSELCVMPEECCFRVPDHVSFEDAALVEPLSIGAYAVKQSIPMGGARIGILGMGPIGLSVMLPALAWGAARVYATDRLDYRCQMAREHGATWTGNPDACDVVAEIEDREPLLLDAVFECCGQQEALDQAFQLLKPGGKLMLIGIPEFDRYSFSAEAGRRREVCLQNVRRQNGCVQTALDLIAAGDISPNFMVTHRFSLDDSKKAFDLVDGYADGVVKAMINV